MTVSLDHRNTHDNELILVQFWPCGHVSALLRNFVEKITPGQIELIESGPKLDAVILDQDHCPVCVENRAMKDREGDLYDL